MICTGTAYRPVSSLLILRKQNPDNSPHNGAYSSGCLAGGRVYLHINANGDYEPCAFIHYSDTNARTHPPPKALQAPLFTAYKEGQPWNTNHLRPCSLLDNPKKPAETVE